VNDANLRPLVPVALFASGVALIGISVTSGEAEVSLVLIFPVISGSGGMFILGTVLIIFSFVVGFALLAMGQLEVQRAMLGPSRGDYWRPEDSKTEKKYGGVVLVGPIPIAFGSDKTVALIMLVVGIVMAIILLGILIALV
jgi:uncharacterized protein (TIGR00304 family)